MVKANHRPEINTFIAASFKAVKAGTATKEQQIEFYRFLMITLCMSRTDAYAETDRDTAFQLGRQWVGLQVASISDVDLIELANKEKRASKGSK